VRREWILAILSTVVAVGFANTFGASWVLLAYLAFLLLTLALAITDIDALRIVDRLNLRGTAILAVFLVGTSLLDGDVSSLGRAGLAALAYFVGTNLMFMMVRGRGFGYGDVKLSVQLGLFTGYISWGTLGWAVLTTALLGGVISIVILLGAGMSRARVAGDDKPSMRDSMRIEMPYGPPMIIGAWLAIVLAGLGAFPIPS
jgi:leader peptidase (prepilin peptidase)/N-methyltransferase